MCAARRPARSSRKRRRIHSVATVQLSVVTWGSQPPIESQNAEASQGGSTAGLVTMGEPSDGSPESHHYRTFDDGADTDSRHHVVTSPGADGNAGAQPHCCCGFGTDLTQEC